MTHEMFNAKYKMQIDLPVPSPGPSHVMISSLIQHFVGRGDRCGVPSFLPIYNLYEVSISHFAFPILHLIFHFSWNNFRFSFKW